jgi:hypothetical protein
MAKKFIYDSAGTYNATLTDGTVSGSTFSVSSSITNELYAQDQNISNAITSYNIDDAIRFGFSSAQTIDTVALYFTGASSGRLDIFPDGGTATSLGSTAGNDASLGAGWNIIDITEASNDNWFLVATVAEVTGLSEVILGKTLTFPFNPNLNSKESKQFGVDVVESYGGNEYANKRHDGKRMWEISFSNLTETDKTNFESMRDAISTNFLKFLYYDDSSYYWVRALKGSFEFTEVAYQAYNMNVKMIEQLA